MTSLVRVVSIEDRLAEMDAQIADMARIAALRQANGGLCAVIDCANRAMPASIYCPDCNGLVPEKEATE